MTKLIGFSGPPRSGKDSISAALGCILADKGITVQLLTPASPMRQVVYTLLGVEDSDEHYHVNKDVPQEIFAGLSIRQAMIKLSEEWVKPAYGERFWTMSMLNRMYDPPPQVVIATALGFDVEAQVLVEHFGIENCVFPQIVRPGYTFEGDSRSYTGVPDRITSIINDEDVETAARRVYGRLVNQFGWEFG